MILLFGLASEPPLERVRNALAELGAHVIVVDQRSVASMGLEIVQTGATATGWLRVGTTQCALDGVRGVYARAFSEQNLPEFWALAPELRSRASALFALFHAWCEVTPARVLNRASVMGSNASKPYQAARIERVGFATPDTLITNDPDAVLAFLGHHRRVIYKSLSGVRSIVSELDDQSLARLANISCCPVQFQELVVGVDIRVHVVGDEIFASEILSTAIDYRYASRDACGRTELRTTTVDDVVAERCFTLANLLELPVCGIDLRITDDGSVYCFEVNPSPGFSYYEANTGQPIAKAIARYLTG